MGDDTGDSDSDGNGGDGGDESRGGDQGPGGARGTEVSEAFGALVDELRSLEGFVLDHPAALDDDQYRAEAYRWIFSILQVGLDCFVWGDAANPRFVDIVGPYKKWGGDNADAFYEYAPLDPSRTYRVTGRRGDAVYLSLTVYGGPDDGRYSERIVGSINDRDLTFDADGAFAFWLTPDPSTVDGPAIRLEPDAVCAITRDYVADASSSHRVEWRIEAIDPPPTWRNTTADVALGFRRALTWIRDQAAITPLGLGEPNTVDAPYPVPTATFGWAAGDAAYAMGSFALADGEALVLRGRSPECVFWNLCLWNPFLHTYNSDYDRVTINGTQVAFEPDGSWTLVVAADDPGHPNWLCTQGHAAGRLWFRWFLPAHTPDPIDARVVPIADVPTGPVS
ncbi:MAG: DUF1214 domain-containing protein [Acidimicrobiales bacterium]